MSVLLYVGIISILCMYHIKYYVMFGDMLSLCYVAFIMLGYICNIMLHLYVMPF